MNRVEYFYDKTMINFRKFILKKEYKGFGIYEEKKHQRDFLYISHI